MISSGSLVLADTLMEKYILYTNSDTEREALQGSNTGL